jgi:hypothetical protein
LPETKAYVLSGSDAESPPIINELGFELQCELPPSIEELVGKCELRLTQGRKTYILALPVRVVAAKILDVQPTLVVFAGRGEQIMDQKRHLRLVARDRSIPIVIEAPTFLSCRVERLTPECPEEESKWEYSLVVHAVGVPTAEERNSSIIVQLGAQKESVVTVGVQALLSDQ